MTARPIVTALVAGLCVTQAWIRPSAQTTTSQQPPIFTAAVDMARLDVRVVDRNGQPLTDLRPDEVRVVEGGVPRPVVLLQRVSEAGRSYVEAAQRTVAAEISTNQGAPRGQLYVLLFDQEHITAGAEQKVRRAAERFLKERVQPQDRVAVYGLPAPGPTLAFTNNTRTAIEQLQHVRGGLTRLQMQTIGEMTEYEAYEILRGNEAVLTRFLLPSDNGTSSRASAIADLAKLSGKRDDVSLDEQRRTLQQAAQDIVTRADGDARRFLQLATELFRGLRHVDGRKTVVLFSEGFFGDRVSTEVQTLAAAAAETYSVIEAFELNARSDTSAVESTASDTNSEILSRTQTLSSIAAETGGTLVRDAMTHLDQALGALGTSNTDYYIVGFESSPAARENRTAYQKVDVTVTRPGARVETRTGYTAGLDGRSLNAYESLRRLTIDNALAAPYGHQGLRVEYTTYQSHGSTPSSERVVLSLEAELPVAAPAVDALPQKADVVFVVREARSGRLAGSGSDQIPLPTTVSPGRTTGIGRWRVQFTLAPGEYLMRAIVREPGGVLGSADRQFTVRAMGGLDVTPSDLILGRPTPALPVRATAYTAEPLPATVRVYARTASQLDKISARLELLPVGGTAAVAAATGVVTDARDLDGQAMRDVVFDVPVANVPAGEYVAKVEIRAGAEFVAELRRQVTVIVGANPAPAPAAAVVEPVVPSAAADSDIAQTLLKSASGSTDPSLMQAATGIAHLKAGRYADAVASLTAAFDAGQSRSAPVAFLLGWAQRGAGRLVDAVSAFRSAAALDAAMIPAHLALATTYLELQQPALAVQALEAGLAKQPNAVELTRLLETIKR